MIAKKTFSTLATLAIGGFVFALAADQAQGQYYAHYQNYLHTTSPQILVAHQPVVVAPAPVVVIPGPVGFVSRPVHYARQPVVYHAPRYRPYSYVAFGRGYGHHQPRIHRGHHGRRWNNRHHGKGFSFSFGFGH